MNTFCWIITLLHGNIHWAADCEFTENYQAYANHVSNYSVMFQFVGRRVVGNIWCIGAG